MDWVSSFKWLFQQCETHEDIRTILRSANSYYEAEDRRQQAAALEERPRVQERRTFAPKLIEAEQWQQKCAEIAAREDLTRREKMAAMRDAGVSLGAIGKHYGITKQCVHQQLAALATSKRERRSARAGDGRRRNPVLAAADEADARWRAYEDEHFGDGNA
jgi:hypothetical protein